jgi:hypothetical protein
VHASEYHLQSKTVIFDLSEVLIAGLCGVEETLAPRVGSSFSPTGICWRLRLHQKREHPIPVTV